MRENRESSNGVFAHILFVPRSTSKILILWDTAITLPHTPFIIHIGGRHTGLRRCTSTLH